MWVRAGRVVRPQTIFFGGGTPTALPASEMKRLLDGLRQTFDFSALDEWTVEANPATIDAHYCSVLLDAGVDRISFGAQSFDRTELQMLERHHDPDDVFRSVDMARTAGFTRINVDLIYAIPGQDAGAWQRSLDRALSLGLTHLSCYGLTYESNTAMTVRKRLGQFSAVPEGVEVDMFHMAHTSIAAAGLQAYEISNFARAGEECRHNLHYWKGGNYAALGPSGASHVSGTRFRNPPHLGEWERAIESGALPAIDIESLKPAQRAGELIMLMLRLPAGVRFDEIQNRFDIDARQIYCDELTRLSEHGLIIVDDVGFRLAEKGLILADAIAAEFVSP